MAAVIRLASENDAAGIYEIYAPIVRETAISFEFEPPSNSELAWRIKACLEFAPWLVCEVDGEILGYAYASRFRTREAYQWTVEVTVYVGDKAQRKGIARALYNSLFDCLRLQGFCGAIAIIALPNPASVALHEIMGFEKVGVFPSVGYKHGKWHDVGWWRLQLGEFDIVPLPPKPLVELVDTPEWLSSLEKGVGMLTL